LSEGTVASFAVVEDVDVVEDLGAELAFESLTTVGSVRFAVWWINVLALVALRLGFLGTPEAGRAEPQPWVCTR